MRQSLRISSAWRASFAESMSEAIHKVDEWLGRLPVAELLESELSLLSDADVLLLEESQ